MIADGLSRIAMSSGLAASLSRATDYARGQGHAEVTLEHMLLALCDDADAALVLAASNVNVAELTAEVGAQISAMPAYGQMHDSELSVAADLRRILEAAAAAARGGRRREINGAIVLAAIVGDGKSNAARVLSALGMTFEGAIRALQSKSAAPEAPRRPAPDAEAILASARERVQSRTVLPPPRPAPVYEEPAYEEPAREEPAYSEYEEAVSEPAPPPQAKHADELPQLPPPDDELSSDPDEPEPPLAEAASEPHLESQFEPQFDSQFHSHEAAPEPHFEPEFGPRGAAQELAPYEPYEPQFEAPAEGSFANGDLARFETAYLPEPSFDPPGANSGGTHAGRRRCRARRRFRRRCPSPRETLRRSMAGRRRRHLPLRRVRARAALPRRRRCVDRRPRLFPSRAHSLA
ncbi:MAG: Clp protease N-terminal domain-containing protein [Hyphomicrobium sp.]